MGSEQPWVQPNAADPLRNESSILARCHVAVRTATAGEQELAGPFASGLQVVIDRLAGTPAATSSTRMATTSQPRSLLSIARLNMARSRARPSIWSFVRIDQTCLGRRGGFAPVSFPLFHGTRMGAGGAFT